MAIGDAECGACGMVVREQPAPRVQVVHRDGTRAFLCSVDDARQYLRSPTPHGEAVEIWVETVAPAMDPQATPVEARPWVAATAGHYVVGVERAGVMGPPVLAYAAAADAAAVAERHGGVATTWAELLGGAGAAAAGHDHLSHPEP